MRYLHPILLTFALLLALLMIASPSQATVATEITVERFVYDGQVSFDYDEYVKICNISGGSINLGGTNPWRIGDDESADGDDEAMYALQGTLLLEIALLLPRMLMHSTASGGSSRIMRCARLQGPGATIPQSRT